MKDYLCYAKLISEGRKENATQILASLNDSFDTRQQNIVGGESITMSGGVMEEEQEGRFEMIIKNELQKLGYQVDYRIGHSDIYI